MTPEDARRLADKIQAKFESELLASLDTPAAFSNGTNCTTAHVTLKGLQEVAEKMKAMAREEHRSEALMVERFRCSVCGRGVTVTSSGMGKEYVVCRHAEAALRAACNPVDLAQNPAAVMGGVWISVLDDGPARW